MFYWCCCGIDVHKKMIVDCLNMGSKQELQQFGTTAGEVKTLAKWLSEKECEMIAIESTGIYWKPLYNLFELTGLCAMIVSRSMSLNIISEDKYCKVIDNIIK